MKNTNKTAGATGRKPVANANKVPAPNAKRKAPQQKVQKKVRNKQKDEVTERIGYYTKGVRLLSILAGVSTFTLVASLGVTVYMKSRISENAYFAGYDNGTLVNMIPLSQPNQADANVAAWLQEGLIDIFDFNYFNYKSAINDSLNEWFTPNGASAFVETLKGSKFIETVTTNKFIVSYSPVITPIVVKKSLNRSTGMYLWQLQTEGLVTYRNEGKVFSDRYLLTVEIERMSLRSNPKGLGISKIIMTRSSGNS